MHEAARPETLLLSGALCTGKTTLAQALALRCDGHVIMARDVLHDAMGSPLTRRGLQEAGEKLERKTLGAWLAEAVRVAERSKFAWVIVDAVRTPDQLQAIQQVVDKRTLVIHLKAENEERRRRFEGRDDVVDAGISFDVAERAAVERRTNDLEPFATLTIDTTSLDAASVLSVALRHIQPT